MDKNEKNHFSGLFYMVLYIFYYFYAKPCFIIVIEAVPVGTGSINK
jgi:hypothetical protein